MTQQLGAMVLGHDGAHLLSIFVIKQLLWTKEFIIGDYQDESNPFYWNKVHLNLTGLPGYSPRHQWVAKV